MISYLNAIAINVIRITNNGILHRFHANSISIHILSGGKKLMETLLLIGIFLILVALTLYTIGAIALSGGEEAGIAFAIVGVILMGTGVFISINSQMESVNKEVKTTALNYMMSAEEVSVITNRKGKLEYTLIDSTKLDLFNYLTNEIKEKK